MMERPWAVWVIVAMATGVALYQFPTYHIPAMYAPLYFLGCGLLIWGFYAGARWAFVINVITAWIFPYETWIGIKAPLHGTTLTILQCISLGLMAYSWRFYWRRGQGEVPTPTE